MAAAASPTAAASLTAAAATKAPASERAATAKEAAPTEEAAAALLTAAAATEAPATERAELAEEAAIAEETAPTDGPMSVQHSGYDAKGAFQNWKGVCLAPSKDVYEIRSTTQPGPYMDATFCYTAGVVTDGKSRVPDMRLDKVFAYWGRGRADCRAPQRRRVN